SLISVRAYVPKFDSVPNLLAFPHNFVETLSAAMQRILRLDLWNVVGPSVQGKLAPRNAVPITPNDCTEERCIRFRTRSISVNRIEAEHHIGDLAVVVRHS